MQPLSVPACPSQQLLDPAAGFPPAWQSNEVPKILISFKFHASTKGG